ncbi:orotidine-5'-phosphate decarboxylase [Candidatus Peregrinibacteria bacterium]|nr:orotidine-5'-phosphate decarboxylase [Candidatus Peregrinibacteria bacterium]
MQHFSDKLIQAIRKKKSAVCVGLDPRISQIPDFICKKSVREWKKSFQAAGSAIFEFNKGIIDAVADLVPVVKPQIAFYELFGAEGISAFIQTIDYAKKNGLLVIADVKRNDIGSTAEAYAQAFLGESDVFEKKLRAFDADAVTVTPYLGYDGIKPFLESCRQHGKGIFVLVKTSNPSSGDLQDIVSRAGISNYETMAHLLESWGADDVGKEGYSSVGAVVGATYPRESAKLRKIMPRTIFLVPGYGAQGACADDVKVCFDKNGLGAIVNSSRDIIFAYKKSKQYGEKQYGEAAREAVMEMNRELGVS